MQQPGWLGRRGERGGLRAGTWWQEGVRHLASARLWDRGSARIRRADCASGQRRGRLRQRKGAHHIVCNRVPQQHGTRLDLPAHRKLLEPTLAT